MNLTYKCTECGDDVEDCASWFRADENDTVCENCYIEWLKKEKAIYCTSSMCNNLATIQTNSMQWYCKDCYEAIRKVFDKELSGNK